MAPWSSIMPASWVSKASCRSGAIRRRAKLLFVIQTRRHSPQAGIDVSRCCCSPEPHRAGSTAEGLTPLPSVEDMPVNRLIGDIEGRRRVVHQAAREPARPCEYTAEAIATRREIAKLLRDARALVKEVS